MRKYALVIGGLLLSVVLGATVFSTPLAWAAQAVNATIVGPLDANGSVKVHEQGTAAVRSANEEVSASHLFQDSGPIGATCEGTLYTVPAGKQLVVEWVGGMGQGSGVQPAGAIPSGQIISNLLNIPIVWEPGFAGLGGAGVSASQAVHFTFPAGAVLTFQAGWEFSTLCNFFMSLGGHLEPTP